MSIVRDITLHIKGHLESEELLLFIGPRQSGKTTLLKQIQQQALAGRQTYYLTLEDPDYLRLLNESPKNLFKIFPLDERAKSFVLIDEVQYLQNPSNFLKYLYDEYRSTVKILASGSSAFYLDKKFKDSLAGRKKLFNVLTLSFREFLRFKNEAVLSEKNLDEVSISEKETISRLYREYIIWGGYPRVVLAPPAEKIDILRDIAYSYIKKDVFEAGIRQEEVFYKLCKILAAQIGNLANASELAGTLGVSKTAINHYLTVMQKSFHIRLIRPFFKNMRKELTRMPKVYFLDTGLRNFFVDNFKPLELREDSGALLENTVFRQLLETSDADDIRFWRTIQGHEIDFVVKEERVLEVKTQPTQMRERNYAIFHENYPDIPFSIVSLDVVPGQRAAYPVVNPWDV